LFLSLVGYPSFAVWGQAVKEESTAPQKTDISQPTAIKAASLGSTKNVHQCGKLYFSGQFAKADLETIQERQIDRIITLRNDKEIDWNEQQAVEAAGIEHIKVPFGSPDALTDEVFDNIRQLLKDDTKTTLIHCASGSRVGGVWLTHRVLDEGMDLETAVAEAREIGLKTPFIEAKARDYIQRRSPAPTLAGETSVRPGINQKFIDPNLDVDAFVKRFEIESREIYIARERILAACEIEKGDVVADVGAGTGLFTRMFSVETGDQGWVFAVDVAPRFIEHINREAIKLELENITGVLCAENSVNLPADFVDVVFVCDTYHHFEYPKSTLASIRRALKKDGHLIVIDFERIPGTSREWLLDHVRAGKSVFRGEIEATGFVLEAEKKIAGFQENYFLKFRKAE
jgi:uncharacterized protein (TIGR01244 family)